MPVSVCLSADTLSYVEGGGHMWVFLNWALGLRALDCRVIWLEPVDAQLSTPEIQAQVTALKRRLAPYGLAEHLALCSRTEAPLPPGATRGCMDLEAAAEADLLLNLRYDLPAAVVERFRRSALLDIDPGELQIWMAKREIVIVPHDRYFTIGETVGQPGTRIPDVGIPWQYTPPCVALDWWPPRWAGAGAPFTTVAHWYDAWVEDAKESYDNTKRSGFLPFLGLPKHTNESLELALDMPSDDDDQMLLWEQGWRVREASAIAATPWDYQRYIQDSRGEFSCVKLHCIRLANAWISDRTLCYLASGKPAIVQHTGPSRFLPDAEGLFRFRDMEEAVRSLETVAAEYEHHCRRARALAAEHFDARKVVRGLLERALP